MPSGVSRQQMACIHYASTLSCMPSTKGIPLRLLSIHRSLACHCPVTRDTQRQTPCISYLSHAFHYSLRDLSASDKQRHTLCIRSFSHAVRCLATAEGIPYASFLHPLSRMPSGVSRQLKINSLHSWACMCSKEQCNGFATRLRLMLAPCL